MAGISCLGKIEPISCLRYRVENLSTRHGYFSTLKSAHLLGDPDGNDNSVPVPLW